MKAARQRLLLCMTTTALILVLLCTAPMHATKVPEDVGRARNRGTPSSSDNHAAVSKKTSNSIQPPAAAVGTVLQGGKTLLQLMMIVKNEATSIEAVLRSSLPHVDSWYIMDTGSDDDTIDIITRVTNEYPLIPGVLDKQPFVDFATTRNLALDRAGTGAMFKLFIDGDWYLEGAQQLRAELANLAHNYAAMHDQAGVSACSKCEPCFRRQPALDGADCASPGCISCSPTFLLRLLLGNLDYYVPRIIRGDAPDRFTGVVHEVIGPHGVPHLQRDAMIIVNATDTNRGHSKDRWFRDQGLLEKEHERDPSNARTAFYLAQTYALVGEPKLAYSMNIKRVQLGAWVQERYVALLRAGRQALKAGLPFETAKKHWLEAHALLPDRCETLYEIANWYKVQKQHALCVIYAVAAVAVEKYPPADSLFIESEVYNYKRHDVLGVCAWYTGQYDAGYAAAVTAFKAEPTAEHTRKNIGFYKGKVANFKELDDNSNSNSNDGNDGNGDGGADTGDADRLHDSGEL